MKKYLIGLAVFAVILAVVLGIQVGQTNTLNDQVKDLESQIEALGPVKNDLEEASTKVVSLTADNEALSTELQTAKKNQEELTSQIETLNDPKVLADKSKLENDYKALLTQYDELTQKNQEFEKQQVLLTALAEEQSKLRGDLEAELKNANGQIDAFADTVKATQAAKDEALQMAETTKNDALQQAEEIKTAALNEAEQIKTDAQKAVEQAKADAVKQVDAANADALQKIETIRAEALKEVETAKAEATTAMNANQTEIEQMLNEKIKTNTAAYNEKTAELQELIDKAKQEAADLNAKLQAELNEKEAIRSEAAAQVEAAKAAQEKAEAEAETAKADADQAIEAAKAENEKAMEVAQAATVKAQAEVDELNTKLQAESNEKEKVISELNTLRIAAQEQIDAASTALVTAAETTQTATAESTAEPVVQTTDVLTAVDEKTKASIWHTFTKDPKASIWHTFTKDQEAYLTKAAADFNASHEDVEIELFSQPYEGFLGNVRSAVAEGVGPDIIFNYASEAASYVKDGLVADLSQYIYDDEIGIEGFEDSLVSGVMDGEVKAFEDGVIHYLPAYTTGPILYYNKTLFEELNLQVPTTWEEMEEAAKTIYEAKQLPALGFDSLTDLVQMFIMETPGAGYIDVENQQVLFDTPEVREKIEWLIDMVKKGYFLVKPTGNYFSEDFNSGIVAAYIGSSAGYPYIKPADDKFEFAMAPVPAQTWFPSWNRGPIVFYYKDDARAEAAYEFVKYFITPEVNAGWAEAVVALAPYSWTKDNEAYQAFIGEDTLAAQALKAVEANLDIAGSLPAVEGANVVRDALKAAIEKAALGNMSVDEAWTEAVTVSNAALKGE